MKKPLVNEQVALVVPGTGRVMARVDQVGETFLKLALDKRPKGAPKLRRDDEATLLFSGDRGIAELKGALRREGFGAASVRFEFEASKQMVQRRRHVRVDAQLPVVLRQDHAAAGLVKSHTLNVSGGGLEIADRTGLPVGSMVKIELRLPGSTMPVPLTGRIVRRARPHTKGVRIERIISSDQDRLVRFIFERQRQELRAKRNL